MEGPRPRDLLVALLLRWPWLLLGGVLGACVGLGVSYFRPPVYEAVAVIAIGIDYGRTEPLPLLVEDRALDRVWAYLTSDETLSQVGQELASSLGESDDWTSPASLREHLRLDDKLSRWEFVGIHRDPEAAQTLANTWARVALARLDEASYHAWRAAMLQGDKFQVGCFAESSGPLGEVLTRCLTDGVDIAEADLAELQNEIRASHGILPILQYELVSEAALPTRPVVWGRASLVLAGAWLGLLLAAGSVLSVPRLSRSVRVRESESASGSAA